MGITNLMARLTTKVVQALASVTATTTTTGVATSDLEGVARIRFSHVSISGTSPTIAWALQTCATSGGTYVAMTGITAAAAASGDVSIAFDTALSLGFVRAVATIGGTSTPTLVIGSWLSGFKRVNA